MMTIFTNKFIRQGAPFVVLVVGAPFFLQYFNRIRYDYRRNRMMSQQEQLKVEEVAQARKQGIPLDKNAELAIQQAREAAKKDWKNIRGPKPWEDSRELQTQQNTSSS
ncbi:cytochrome c oxidase assembly protein COX16 homolog, mitochondrial-like [Watersipora subatra]|uniref:cytochrome c oxidase assembly protein COX16 homolog, mitochondrial-like n=1 Tax=Watersipora subatra TaxID=2589382 RepID=UPI00355B931B